MGKTTLKSLYRKFLHINLVNFTDFSESDEKCKDQEICFKKALTSVALFGEDSCTKITHLTFKNKTKFCITKGTLINRGIWFSAEVIKQENSH